jgi:predicted nucleic acid-binding protein
MALLQNEPSASQVRAILETSRAERVQVYLPFMTLMEVEYLMIRRLQRRQLNEVMGMIRTWPVTVFESTPEWRARAATLKATGGLSLADAWIASLALLLNAELVHKDPEYDAVPGLKAVRLPDVVVGEPV